VVVRLVVAVTVLVVVGAAVEVVVVVVVLASVVALVVAVRVLVVVGVIEEGVAVVVVAGMVVVVVLVVVVTRDTALGAACATPVTAGAWLGEQGPALFGDCREDRRTATMGVVFVRRRQCSVCTVVCEGFQ
jgi:hypothetical protein